MNLQGRAVKIESVRIQNFRGFEDETIPFEDHTCLVGQNGAGKSTVLGALNIFFQETSSATDVSVLSTEDFHNGETKQPIEITVTFRDLSDAAKSALSHYVRQDHLVVTAVATFDQQTGRAPVEQKGERMVFKKFAPWFEDEKNKVLAGPLKERFRERVCPVTRASARTRGFIADHWQSRYLEAEVSGPHRVPATCRNTGIIRHGQPPRWTQILGHFLDRICHLKMTIQHCINKRGQSLRRSSAVRLA